MMDTNKIAEIIRRVTYTHSDTSQIIPPEDLIEALCDAYEAENSLCFYKMRCQHEEHDFDRAAFVHIATGEK